MPPSEALKASERAAEVSLSWQVAQADGSLMSWELLCQPEEASASAGASLVPVRGERPWGHTYSAALISTAINLVLWANTSFRGAMRSLQLICAEAAEACPSLWSIRNWVLRLGLYELERPKPAGGNWALILDHTIQLGPHKALLVLGVNLEGLDRESFALRHQDVVVLGLEICEESNHQKVLAALEKAREQVRELRQIVSDAGSDLKKAAGLFCQSYPETDWVLDVSHRMARLLEAELKEDPKWESFLSQAAQCRSQCQQTAFYRLRPPPQPGKARWMNYQPLVHWGLNLIESPIPSWAESRQFQRLFGWLDDYYKPLMDYCLMMGMGQETCRIIKQRGIDAASVQETRQMLQEFAYGSRPRRYAAGIRDYLQEVASKLRPGEKLLGSSDIIESIFGKYKFLVERSPQRAITRLILSIGALVSKRTPELVRQAMETIPIKAVEKWFHQYIGPNVCSPGQ